MQLIARLLQRGLHLAFAFIQSISHSVFGTQVVNNYTHSSSQVQHAHTHLYTPTLPQTNNNTLTQAHQIYYNVCFQRSLVCKTLFSSHHPQHHHHHHPEIAAGPNRTATRQCVCGFDCPLTVCPCRRVPRALANSRVVSRVFWSLQFSYS